MDRLIQHHLIPVVQGIEQHGDINGKLIWSNTGFTIYWFLGEIAPLIGEILCNELEQAFSSRVRYWTVVITHSFVPCSCVTAKCSDTRVVNATGFLMYNVAAIAR